MKFNQLSYLAALAGSRLAAAQEAHGEGLVGTEMGPVAFMWPSDRPWSATADNTAPCGSTAGVSNRTDFPLSQGSVALSIADDAWNVAFSIAYDNNPTTQSQFSQQVVGGIAAIEPGHQCYKIADISRDVEAGSNATIQLEYWSSMEDELDGRNQTFYACADITFVEASDFDIQVPCFNVTSSDFDLPDDSDSSSSDNDDGDDKSSSDNSESSPTAAPSGNDGDFGSGLSKGAKAGIAVGVIVASLAIVGGIAFFVLRRRRATPGDHESAASGHPTKAMREVPSVSSLRN